MKEKITVQFGGEKTLDSAFEHFIQSRIVLNSAPETITFYRNIFRYFLEFFGDGRLCEEVDEDVIFDYLLYIKQNKPDMTVDVIPFPAVPGAPVAPVAPVSPCLATL